MIGGMLVGVLIGFLAGVGVVAACLAWADREADTCHENWIDEALRRAHAAMEWVKMAE